MVLLGCEGVGRVILYARRHPLLLSSSRIGDRITHARADLSRADHPNIHERNEMAPNVNHLNQKHHKRLILTRTTRRMAAAVRTRQSLLARSVLCVFAPNQAEWTPEWRPETYAKRLKTMRNSRIRNVPRGRWSSVVPIT